MKKKEVKKIALDLDAALEEVAQKLKPSANMPGCGNTNIYNTSPHTGLPNNAQCYCWCCSDSGRDTGGTGNFCI